MQTSLCIYPGLQFKVTNNCKDHVTHRAYHGTRVRILREMAFIGWASEASVSFNFVQEKMKRVIFLYFCKHNIFERKISIKFTILDATELITN